MIAETMSHLAATAGVITVQTGQRLTNSAFQTAKLLLTSLNIALPDKCQKADQNILSNQDQAGRALTLVAGAEATSVTGAALAGEVLLVEASAGAGDMLMGQLPRLSTRLAHHHAFTLQPKPLSVWAWHYAESHLRKATAVVLLAV